ncbi:hypothetical protein DIPPA_06515 [Diplonema papillatum]|nr:hypothetical protein DIPPA_06515 [Diplonema papillatum]
MPKAHFPEGVPVGPKRVQSQGRKAEPPARLRTFSGIDALVPATSPAAALDRSHAAKCVALRLLQLARDRPNAPPWTELRVALHRQIRHHMLEALSLCAGSPANHLPPSQDPRPSPRAPPEGTLAEGSEAIREARRRAIVSAEPTASMRCSKPYTGEPAPELRRLLLPTEGLGPGLLASIFRKLRAAHLTASYYQVREPSLIFTIS